MANPTDRKYTSTDEWVKPNGNIVTIGITDFAQSQLNDVVFVEITVGVGDTIKRLDVIATIESVKAAAEVNSPVAGTVVEVNEAILNENSLLNTDPFEAGWIIKVETSNGSLENMMDAAAYDKYCSERG